MWASATDPGTLAGASPRGAESGDAFSDLTPEGAALVRFIDHAKAIRDLLQNTNTAAERVLAGSDVSILPAAARMAEDVRSRVVDGGEIPSPPPGSTALTTLVVTGVLAPPLALAGWGAYMAGRKAKASVRAREAISNAAHELGRSKRKLALNIAAAGALTGIAIATGGAGAVAIPLLLASPLGSKVARRGYSTARLWLREWRARPVSEEALTEGSEEERAKARARNREKRRKRIQARRYRLQHKVLEPAHHSLREMLRQDRSFQGALERRPRTCSDWIDRLASYYRAVGAAKRAMPGMQDVLSFYLDLLTELDERTVDFEKRLPSVMDRIAAQIYAPHDGHAGCTLTGAFSDISSTRSLKHGICYELVNDHRGWHPRRAKHSSRTTWERDKFVVGRTAEAVRPYVMLKLFHDAANWGNLMKGFAKTPRRGRLVRAFDYMDQDLRRLITKKVLPGFFDADGKYKFVSKSAVDADVGSVRSTPIPGAAGTSRAAPLSQAGAELGVQMGLTGASKTGQLLLNQFATGVLSSGPAITNYALSAATVAADFFNRRLNRASFATGRKLTRKQRLKAMMGKSVSAAGEFLSPEEFIELEIESLTDTLEALGDAWKDFDRACEQFEVVASKQPANCREAFEMAAVILRHRQTFYTLVSYAGAFHEYVGTVGMAFLSVAQALVEREPELVKELSQWLGTAHIKREPVPGTGSGALEEQESTTLCPGFCYAPLTPNLIDAIDHTQWGYGYVGDAARPIGGNHRITPLAR